MKTFMLFGPADAAVDFRGYEPMLQNSEIAQSIYREFAEVIEVPVSHLIDGEVLHVHPVLLRWIRQMAAMLSVGRIVEHQYGAVSVYGGVSLGELAALHSSGAASTEMVVRFLRERHLQDTQRDEAIGFAFVPASIDWRYYNQPDQMTISCDFGSVLNGAGRMIMVSGLRATLESARSEGPVDLQVVDRSLAHQAYHSPFREPSRQRLEALLKENELGHPKAPVITAVPGMHTLFSGVDAAKALVASETRSLDVPGLIEALRQFAPEKVYVISSFLRQLEIDFQAATEYVDDSWLKKNFG
ncbi:hypothetical protein GCM10010387_24030 [Streptomyces inusitatus]|uniref:Malonyl-CoA:ACP transacylase (MAT) domain-containing protein n=1 Tax=Streptomyces inusitatus TaxID=68221 RepID=A0A918Q130_9ACTN|nr:hypothetical protein [Streptomyces inusitatus]GGZ29817.1 hypothetical protein GCM10010387_24030 [Streptomyces inusitatus]